MNNPFINITTQGGNVLINVNDISFVERHPLGCRVVMQSKDSEGINHEHIATMQWGDVTGRIQAVYNQ